MDGSLEKDETKKRLGWLDFGKVMGILVVLLVHAECAMGPVTFMEACSTCLFFSWPQDIPSAAEKQSLLQVF